MSAEFFCTSTLSADDADALLQALAVKYDVLSSHHVFEIRLRYPLGAVRSYWPEDATLSLTNGVSVAIHSGTQKQRDELMTFLSEAILKMGHGGVFVED